MRLKHFLSVFLTLLTLSVGQVWGGTTKSATFKSSGSMSTTITTSGSELTVTSDVTPTAWNSGAPGWSCASASNTIKLTSTTFSSKYITKVSVTCKRTKSKTITASVTVGGNAYGGDAQISEASTSYNTFDFEDAVGKTGNIVITLTSPGGSQNADKGTLMVSTVTIIYEESAQSSCNTTPTVSNPSNSSISLTTATVSCSGITKGDCDVDEWGFFYKTGTSGVTSSDTKVQVSNGKSTTNVSAFNKAMSGLSPNTHYYFKAYAKVGETYTLSTNETDFTTKNITSTSSSTTYGTVSRSGMVITGHPNEGCRYASPAYTVTAGNGTTSVVQDGNTFTVSSTSTINVTVRINFEQIPTHTVIWSSNGNTSNTSTVAEGASITFPNTATGCEGGTFVGWVAAAIDGTLDEAPAYVTSATMGDDDITYYAVFATADDSGDDEWVETALGDLTSSDVFVFTDGTYALNNDATSSAPTPQNVTISNHKITSTIGSTLKWNISGNATDGYVFYPDGSTTTWLCCTTTANSGTNNNIRVGDGNRKAWILNNSNQLVTNDNYVDRYLSTYTTPDYRGYTTTGTAINPVFFKFVEGTSYSDYRTSCCSSLGQINGSFFWTTTFCPVWPEKHIS